MKSNEIDILSSIFDEYEDGDGYLSVEQFKFLIDKISVAQLLKELGWKNDNAELKVNEIISAMENNDNNGSVTLIRFLNLSTMLLSTRN